MTKGINQQKKLSIAAKLLLLFIIATYSVSCQHGKTNQSVQHAADSVVWEDSAYQLNAIANNFYNEGQIDSLEAFVPVAMKTCLEHKQMERYYIIWRVLAEKYIWIDEYDKAMLMAMEMEDDAIKRHESHGLFEAYSLLGLGYAYRNNTDESIKYFKKAIAIFQSKNVAPLMEAYNYLAQVLTDATKIQDLAQVLAEWKRQIDKNHHSKTSATPQKWAKWNYQYQRVLTEYLIISGQYDAASAALDSTELYLKQEGNPKIDRIQILYTRCSLASMQHDYETTLKHCQAMLDMATESVDNSHKINAMNMKAKALEGMGRYQEALEWQHKAIDFKDSLTTADNLEQLNMLNKRFEVNELKMDAERNRMKAKERQMFLIILLTVVTIIGLIAFIIYRHQATVKLEKAHSELQKAYEQLEIANAKAEESLRMKSNFIRQISHEINTPLNILSGFTQLITMPNIELSSNEREELNKGIVENTNRISGLVKKMIDLSEANNQTVIERNDTVEVDLIAAQAIESSGISQAAHLEFSQQIPPEVGSIRLTTNQKSASRALALLLDNACKFTAPTETKTGAQDLQPAAEKKHARLTVTHHDNHVLFTVEDDGIGVPPEEAEHIFEEFVQVNIFYEGTGIGLTIARSLARKLGGDITLDASHRGGAHFVMVLPLTT